MDVRVASSATSEELAAVLSAVSVLRSRDTQSAYDRWRRIRLAALGRTGR